MQELQQSADTRFSVLENFCFGDQKGVIPCTDTTDNKGHGGLEEGDCECSASLVGFELARKILGSEEQRHVRYIP